MKKLLILCLFLLAIPSTSYAFNDIDNSRFKEDILFLKGMPLEYLSDDPTKFYPNEPITRQDAALMLYTVVPASFSFGFNDWLHSNYGTKKRSISDAPIAFRDVQYKTNIETPTKHYLFLNALHGLTTSGIFNGYVDQTFRPHDILTRGQAAKILNAAFYLPNESKDTPFKDLSAAYYQQAIRNLYHAGITNGTSATTYSPDQIITRGEFAALLARFTHFTKGFETRYVTQLPAPMLEKLLEEGDKPYFEKVTVETMRVFNLTSTHLEENDYYYVEFLTPVLAGEGIQFVDFKDGVLNVTFGIEPSYSIRSNLAYPAMLKPNSYLLKIDADLAVKEININKLYFPNK